MTNGVKSSTISSTYA